MRNDDSSRFGRFTHVQFDERRCVRGARVETFLLERSRVTNANKPGERSYHVLYYLVVGGGNKYGRLGTNVKDFHYLRQGQTFEVKNVDDAEEYRGLERALEGVGFTETELGHLWTFCAAILQLGNLEFDEIEGEYTDEKGVGSIKDPQPLFVACELLGVDQTRATKYLTCLRKVFGGETVWTFLGPAKAVLARDAAVKIMYSRLFDFVISRINAATAVPESQYKHAAGWRYIGLLDVYGFEFFDDNSFEQVHMRRARAHRADAWRCGTTRTKKLSHAPEPERVVAAGNESSSSIPHPTPPHLSPPSPYAQLCINFANEKLQSFFLDTVFINEETTYMEEGVPFPSQIKVPENKTIVSTCETVFKMLDKATKDIQLSGKAEIEAAKIWCSEMYNSKDMKPKDAKKKVFEEPRFGKVIEGKLDKNGKKVKEHRTKEDHFVVRAHAQSHVLSHTRRHHQRRHAHSQLAALAALTTRGSTHSTPTRSTLACST